jgi:hypothetical protein
MFSILRDSHKVMFWLDPTYLLRRREPELLFVVSRKVSFACFLDFFVQHRTALNIPKSLLPSQFALTPPHTLAFVGGCSPSPPSRWTSSVPLRAWSHSVSDFVADSLPSISTSPLSQVQEIENQYVSLGTASSNPWYARLGAHFKRTTCTLASIPRRSEARTRLFIQGHFASWVLWVSWSCSDESRWTGWALARGPVAAAWTEGSTAEIQCPPSRGLWPLSLPRDPTGKSSALLGVRRQSHYCFDTFSRESASLETQRRPETV